MSTFIACGYDIAWNFDHLRALALVPTRKRGAVAQLGERLNGIQEVDGSIPFGSTNRISRDGPAADGQLHAILVGFHSAIR